LGKTHCKIRDGEVIPVEKCGYRIGVERPDAKYMVTPGSLVEYLTTGKVNNVFPCRHHPDRMVDGLRVNPYVAEIEGKTIYCRVCDDCLDEIAADI
jgi:hypothetical protein